MRTGTEDRHRRALALRGRAKRWPLSRYPGLDRLVVLFTILLAPFLAQIGPARAQASPLLSHSYAYAESATFRLSFVGEPGAEQATFLLQINGVSTDGETVTVADGSATVTRDLERSAFPPFAEITYWWAFDTSDGRWIETDKQRFRYVDNRYAWRTVVDDTIRVHWIVGDASVLAQALDVAAETIDAISAALRTPVQQEIDIYIYPSETDLASALQLGGQKRVRGIAHPQMGVVFVSVPPNTGAFTAMQRDIPHELTHQALYNLLGEEGYASLPTWLDEGLATFFQVSPDPAYAQAIDNALAAGGTIPLSELCAPFPDEPGRARLAYAQSGSLVQYIRLQYGWSRIRELLAAYADGQACSTGVQNVLGVDLTQLERDWRAWLSEGDAEPSNPPVDPAVAALMQDIGPWAMIAGALLLSPLLILAIGRRR